MVGATRMNLVTYMLYKEVTSLLYDKSVEVRVFSKRRSGRRVEVLLLVLAGDMVLVTEDEVHLSNMSTCPIQGEVAYLVPRTRQVRTKHDYPRSGIRELFATRLEPISQKLEVAAAAVAALLVLNLVLYNEGLA